MDKEIESDYLFIFQIFVSLVNGRPGVNKPSSKLLVSLFENFE